MHLAIVEESSWSDRLLCIKDVNLKDGALPTISGQSANIIGLEPAVWAKVKVLNLILINITEQVFHWTTCRPQECAERRSCHGNDVLKIRCSHSHMVRLDSDEIVRQCDYDEILRIAGDALRRSPPHTGLLWEIFRLLHLYVLPLVYFTKDEDERNVDRALEEQNKILRGIEKKLDEKSEQRGKLQKELRSKRQSICKILEQDQFNLEEYSNEFITILESGIKDDLKFAFTEIDKFCIEIEGLSQRGDHTLGKKGFDEILTRIKKERDEYMVHLSRILVVREEIENFCRECKTVNNDAETLSDVQQDYIKDADKWKVLCSVAEKLFWTKIHAVSIREALSFQQLEMKFSNDSPRTKVFSLRVMGRDSVPTEWQTVDEQVTKALENNQSLIAIHQSGKTSIMTHCVSPTLPTPATNSDMGGSKLHRKGGIRRKENLNRLNSCKTACYEQRVTMFCSSFLRASPTAMFGALTTKISKEITSLFQKVTTAFLSDGTINCNNKQRIWICYEKFVFPELLLHYIIPIYQRAHENDLLCLQMVVNGVTLNKLDLDGESKLLRLLGLNSETKEEKEKIIASNNSNNAKPSKYTKRKQTSPTPDRKEVLETASPQTGRKLSATSRRKCFQRQASVDSDSQTLNFVPFDIKRRTLERAESWDLVRKEEVLEDDSVFDDFQKEESSDEYIQMRVLNNNEISSKNTKDLSENVRMNVNEFQKRFQPVFRCFTEALTESVPYIKLERLSRCLSRLTCMVNQQAELQGVSFAMSADDLLSSVILFLAYGHPDIVTAMYTHLVFLRDYIPTFMENGKFGYTLVTFIGAYSSLLEIADTTEKET